MPYHGAHISEYCRPELFEFDKIKLRRSCFNIYTETGTAFFNMFGVYFLHQNKLYAYLKTRQELKLGGN